MEVMTCKAVICSNLTTLMLCICDIIMNEPDCLYEHTAGVGGLDIVSLPTIGAATMVSFSKDDFLNQSQR